MAGLLLAAAEAGGPAGTVSVWWFVLPPAISMIVAVLGIYLAINKDRRDIHKTESDRQERLDHAADAVLGIEANPAKGVLKHTGLIERFDNYEEAQKQMQSTLRSIESTVTRIAGGQADLVHTQEQHTLEDERRFAQIERRLAEGA